MHVGLITGARCLELREVPEPTPPDGGVVVDISLCGICGTDVHAYRSGTPYNPAICGHEWTGVVSAVGQGAGAASEGDRVVVGVAPACGACSACHAGHAGHCTATFLSATGRDPLAPPHGGFAARIPVAVGRIVRADAGLTDEQAAQIEPTTVALHAVRRSGLRLGDIAVVQGAGPIGLLVLQWVRAGGAGEVLVVEPDPVRRQLALAVGADRVIEPGPAAAELVRERTAALGADIVYECAGRRGTIQSAVDLARRGGEMCLVGLADTDDVITPVTWLVKEITVTSGLAYVRDEFEVAMGMVVDGRIRLDLLHSATTPLAGLAQALDELADGGSCQTKVLVKPAW